MEKLVFLTLLLVAAALAGGIDFQLINGTGTGDSPGSRPIWTRTSVSSQPAPIAFGNSGDTDGSHSAASDNSFAPTLYWGNTFTIKNIRVQNDSTTIGRKRLDPSVHFAIQNQTLAMDGQEYLIRPRGFLYTASLAKRAPRPDELPGNGLFNVPSYGFAIQALNVTPQWAAFRLTNTSDPSEAVAFFNSETIDSAGASFELWASNPSIYWFGPGAQGHNISDPGQAYLNQVPNLWADIEWVAACRWIANGTDCGDDAVPVNDVCELVEFGLCWARFNAPEADYQQSGAFEGEITTDFVDNQTPQRPNNWRIRLSSRPITIYDPLANNFEYVQPSAVSVPQLQVDVKANKDSHPIVIGLPLNQESVPSTATAAFTPSGSAQNEWLRRFMPGKDNIGGTVEITVRTVIEVPDTTNFPNQVSRAVTHIQMVPSKIVLSRDQPTASVYFTNITRPLGVSEYVVHFLVTETSPSTSTIANTSVAFGELHSTYPNGAYAIPALVLTPQPYDFELKNFPPTGDDSDVINMPITPESIFNCSAGSAFVAQLAATPASMGQAAISLPFNITPAGSMKFWSCPSPGAKRQSSPTQLSSFTFTGSNTAVVFYVTTQLTPLAGITLSFGTPVLSNLGLLDPVAGFQFAQNGTYEFQLVQNDVHVAITTGEGETDGPFVNQDFFMQFQWTPATLNGFSIAISGQYTTFPSTAVVSNNGTTATFTVPAGLTGFIAGPFRALSPPYLAPSAQQFQAVYAVSLVPKASGTSDNTWYRLPSATEVVTINRHRFAAIDWDGSFYGLLSTGQKSRPFCFGPAFAGALSSTDELWITVDLAEAGLDEQFVIIEPVVAAPNTLPRSALLLTAANPVACFTARMDTNWQFATQVRSIDVETLRFRYSGPSATSFAEVWVANAPTFYVEFPEIVVTFAPSALNAPGAGTTISYYAGETTLMWVTIDSAPPNSFGYNITLPGSTITPVTAGAGVFTSSSPLQQLWQITFDALPVSEAASSHEGIDPLDYWGVSPQLAVTGQDAIFYTYDLDLSVILTRPRTISYFFDQQNPDIFLDDPYRRYASFHLDQPVVSDLTITPYARASGMSEGAVVFEPPSFTFTPDSVNWVDFTLTGVMLGEYTFGWSLSGSDSLIFRYDTEESSILNTFFVSQKSAPGFECFENSIIAGETYRCLTVFDYVEDDITQTIDFGSDIVLSQTSFNSRDGFLQYWDATWVPALDDKNSPVSGEQSGQVWLEISGPDAWKYEAIDFGGSFTFVLRQYELLMNVSRHVAGVRYTGRLRLLEGPAPEGFRVFLLATNVLFYEVGATTPSNSAVLPYIISFAGPADGSVKYFEYEVVAPVGFSGGFKDPHPHMGSGSASKVESQTHVLINLVLDDTFAGNRYFENSVPEFPLALHRRSMYFDSAYMYEWEDFVGRMRQNLNNPLTSSDSEEAVFMVNRESPLYTIVVTAPPANSVTLTITHPHFTFNGGQSSASLFFGPGQLSATFSFMPTRMMTPEEVVRRMSMTLTGPDAHLYEFTSVWDSLSFITIVPDLGFSPIPPIYTDGSVSGLKVWVVDAVDGFSYDPQAAFTLFIVAGSSVVQITPAVLEFTPNSLRNNHLSQEYSIMHMSNTDEFRGSENYGLTWLVMFGNGRWYDITSTVPADARQVIVKRYQLVPNFPHTLNFGWQKASINLTRAPSGYLTLIPHGPVEDGQIVPGEGPTPLQAYSGAQTAGGRIVFDPATIVFAPGQQEAHFRMMAIAGSDQNAVYYRVQWRMVADSADLEHYLDYIHARPDFGGDNHFSTWHVASAAQLSGALLMMLAIVCSLLFML